MVRRREIEKEPGGAAKGRVTLDGATKNNNNSRNNMSDLDGFAANGCDGKAWWLLVVAVVKEGGWKPSMVVGDGASATMSRVGTSSYTT
ncbi:DUF1998 domain-containing protein [Sesbania bispinosa]|nr:DUF1998 domain-containing protein [Sesbania bispinosa]